MYRFITNASSSSLPIPHCKTKLYNYGNVYVKQAYLLRNYNNETKFNNTASSMIKSQQYKLLNKNTLQRKQLRVCQVRHINNGITKIMDRPQNMSYHTNSRILSNYTPNTTNDTIPNQSNESEITNSKALDTTSNATPDTVTTNSYAKNKINTIISTGSNLQILKNFYSLLLHEMYYDPQKDMKFYNITKGGSNPTNNWYMNFKCPISHLKFSSSISPNKKIAKNVVSNDILLFWDWFLDHFYRVFYGIENVNKYFRYDSMEFKVEGEGITLYASEFTCPVYNKIYKSRGGYYTNNENTTSTSYFNTKLSSKRSMYNHILLSFITDVKINANKFLFLNLLYKNSIALSTSYMSLMKNEVQFDFKCPFTNYHVSKTIKNTNEESIYKVLYNNEEFWNVIDIHWKKYTENIYENDMNKTIDFDDYFNITEEDFLWTCPMSKTVYTCSRVDSIDINNIKRNVMWQILIDKQNDAIKEDDITTSQQGIDKIPDTIEDQETQVSLLEELNGFYKPYNDKSFIESISITKDNDVYKGEYTCPVINQHITTTIPIDSTKDDIDEVNKEIVYDNISRSLVASWKQYLQLLYQRYNGTTNIFNYFTHESKYTNRILWASLFTCPYTNKSYKSPYYSKKKIAGYSLLPIILNDWNELVHWNVNSFHELSNFYNGILKECTPTNNIALEDYMTYKSNKINLRGNVKPYFITLVCPLTNETISSVNELKNDNDSNNAINSLLLKSKDEATLNVLLQVLQNIEGKVLDYYDGKLSTRYNDFDCMYACEKIDINWNCKFTCPISSKEYECSNISKLLAKMDILKQLCIDYYKDGEFQLAGLDQSKVEDNFISTTSFSATDNEISDENDDFIVQPIPTSSPMELILQAWDYDSSSLNNKNTTADEATIKANNMLLAVTKYRKLNDNTSFTKISSSTYMRILEALSQVHNLPYKKTSSNPDIILNSLPKVQTMAEKIINHRIKEKLTTKEFNLYLKCLRNANKLKLAQDAEKILQQKIQYPDGETYKLMMGYWNDCGEVCKEKNRVLMELILERSRENADDDDSSEKEGNGVMIDEELLKLGLKSIALSEEKKEQKDDDSDDIGWDINLAKSYIDQAKSCGTVINIEILNVPLQRNWKKNNELDIVRIAEQCDEWLDYIQSHDIEPNIETYSNIMQAWCQVIQKQESKYGMKRAEQMAEKILQSTTDSTLFDPLLKAYANSNNEDDMIHNGLLNRIEKWSDNLGINTTGYYAIMAWCNHFEKCAKEEDLQNSAKRMEILNCAHNCKDWTCKLLEGDENVIDYTLISHVLKIWGHGDILNALPQDGKEIIIKLTDVILQKLKDKDATTTTNYYVLQDLIVAICNLNIENDNNVLGMNLNGFELLFPTIERLLDDLDAIEKTKINDSDIPTITYDDKSNDNRLKQQKGKLHFYRSILKGCNGLANHASRQGDAIRISLKVLNKVLSLSSKQYQKEYIEKDVREIMKDILSISNNLNDYNEQFLDKVFDIIISSSGQNSSKSSQYFMKLCLDVMAQAKRNKIVIYGKGRRRYYGNHRSDYDTVDGGGCDYNGGAHGGRNRKRVRNKGGVVE